VSRGFHPCRQPPSVADTGAPECKPLIPGALSPIVRLAFGAYPCRMTFRAPWQLEGSRPASPRRLACKPRRANALAPLLQLRTGCRKGCPARYPARGAYLSWATLLTIMRNCRILAKYLRMSEFHQLPKSSLRESALGAKHFGVELGYTKGYKDAS
jgi:hypothetical protein